MKSIFELLHLRALSRLTFTPVSAMVLGGCAGPHTPLGAVWSLKPESAQAEMRTEKSTSVGFEPEIRLNPSRQVLHGPSSIQVMIYDPLSDLKNFDFQVRYNGFDVSKAFLLQSRLSRHMNERMLTIENPTVRLSAATEHLIEFSYRNSDGARAYAKFESPACYAFRPRAVSNTGSFKPSPELLRIIADAATSDGLNPAFITGLVAQESRFQPQVVSWAKAVGLTQITSSAEREIAEIHDKWPRYPGVEEMTVDKLKVLILSGRMNPSNEWRLNTRLSVRGGVTYVKILTERWSSESNLQKIRAQFTDPEIAMTQLILASYHSGYARVSAALDRDGRDWIKAPELKEARKYVNLIFSYCSHFANFMEVPNERAS